MTRRPNVPPPELKVGDVCWLLRGTLLHDVTIVEVRRILEGDPAEFCMYRVESLGYAYNYINEQTHHRSDLFAKPEQRADLIARLEADSEALQGIIIELEDMPDEEPQEDNPREKGDDDGVEYADPRDHREERS